MAEKKTHAPETHAPKRTGGSWERYALAGVIGFVLGGLVFCGAKKEVPVKEKTCVTDCSKCQKEAPAPAQPVKAVEAPEPAPAINLDDVIKSTGKKKPHAAAPKVAATTTEKSAGVCGPDKVESASPSEARTYYAAVNTGILELKDRTVEGDTVNGNKLTGTVTYCKSGKVTVTVTGDVNPTLKAAVRKSIESQVKGISPKDVNFAFPYTVNVRQD